MYSYMHMCRNAHACTNLYLHIHMPGHNIPMHTQIYVPAKTLPSIEVTSYYLFYMCLCTNTFICAGIPMHAQIYTYTCLYITYTKQELRAKLQRMDPSKSSTCKELVSESEQVRKKQGKKNSDVLCQLDETGPHVLQR
jgi:hypothetical protein